MNQKYSKPQQAHAKPAQQREVAAVFTGAHSVAGDQAPMVREKALPSGSLIVKFGNKYGVDPEKLLSTLKATAFKTRDGENEVSNEQMVALLVVADQHGLNPFTKEIFAFPDKKNGIIPVVSVDGWIRILNEHPSFDGFELAYSENLVVHPTGEHPPAFEWIEVTIYRKGISRPTVIREYFDEVYKKPFVGKGQNGNYTVNGPWQTHPKRFHRHKTIVQGSRIAFGFAGIYDEDEANRIADNELKVVATVAAGQSRTAAATEALRQKVQPQASKAGAQTEKPVQKEAASDDLPWESEPSKPEAKPEVSDLAADIKHWISELRGCKTIDDLNECSRFCTEHFEGAGLTQDQELDIEATVHLMSEKLVEKHP